MTRKAILYCASLFLAGIAAGWIARPAQRAFYATDTSQTLSAQLCTYGNVF
jgi:hypothetical protein